MARKGHPIQCHASGEMVDAAALVRNVLPGALRRDTESKHLPHALGKPAPPPAPEVFVSVPLGC